ncbi:hypothetical protein [Burkholderia vietnamiensis]|uniref:hypothetical protein n=1 Tax=Burkholderia vietnamiensis TaxID=60552 RepID=UPI00158B0930|nr:hypothetical protein [Burkholderia vietnamiensis]
MSNKFFASGSNARFDLSGAKGQSAQQPAEQKIILPTSRTDFHVDKDVTGETITAIHSVNIGTDVEDAKAWRKALDGQSSYGEEMRPVMDIPGILIEQYCIDKGITLHEFFSKDSNGVHIKAILHDPDLSAFRLRRAYITQK